MFSEVASCFGGIVVLCAIILIISTSTSNFYYPINHVEGQHLRFQVLAMFYLWCLGGTGLFYPFLQQSSWAFDEQCESRMKDYISLLLFCGNSLNVPEKKTGRPKFIGWISRPF